MSVNETGGRLPTRLLTLLLALLLFLCASTANKTEKAMAAAIVFDELGRLLHPEEAFHANNPQAEGQKPGPIPEIDAYDDWGDTRLFNAVREQNAAEVKRLLEAKANPNIRNARGYTALELATSKGSLEIAALLLAGGANPGIGNPLKHAESDEMKALLQKHGAVEKAEKSKRDIRIFSHSEADELQAILAVEEASGKLNPSVVVAVLLGRDPETVSRLLAEGADINEEHPEFGTALWQAIYQRHDREYIAFLLQSGADPNQKWGFAHWWPLHRAIRKKNLVAVEELLKAGAKIRSPHPECGGFLLSEAVEEGNPGAVRLLLAHGADPNERPVSREGRKEYPPLLRAVFYSNRSLEMVQTLLEAGADPKVSFEGACALAVLDWYERDIPIAIALLKAGAPIDHPSIFKEHQKSLVFWAVEADSRELFQAAAQAGVDVTAGNRYQESPLLLAVQTQKPWFVRELLKAGAPVNKSALDPQASRGFFSRPADDLLARAVNQGNLEVVEILIAAGVDLNAPYLHSYNSPTPLHIAVDDGRADILAALLAAKARVDARDRDKETPLHYAVREGKPDMVRLLLEAGANPKLKDKDGRSPLELAENYGRNEEIIRLLKK